MNGVVTLWRSKQSFLTNILTYPTNIQDTMNIKYAANIFYVT